MAKESKRFSNDIQIKNRKARYEYEFLDTFIAGMVLKGTEIKSIREGKVNLTDGYCYFTNGELFARGIHISPYENSSFYSHDETRSRKLLMKKKELSRLESKLAEKGLTLVPIRLFINDRGFAKLEVALAKGKKIYDKRDSIKERDTKREMDRMKF